MCVHPCVRSRMCVWVTVKTIVTGYYRAISSYSWPKRQVEMSSIPWEKKIGFCWPMLAYEITVECLLRSWNELLKLSLDWLRHFIVTSYCLLDPICMYRFQTDNPKRKKEKKTECGEKVCEKLNGNCMQCWTDLKLYYEVLSVWQGLDEKCWLRCKPL